MKRHQVGEIVYYTSDLLDEAGVKHGFFTRFGGVSMGNFSSLNVHGNVGDDPDHVSENIRRCREVLGMDTLLLSWLELEDNIRVIDTPVDGVDTSKRYDSFITDVPGQSLAIGVADCNPILLYDPEHQAVALVHAGRQGVARNIVGKSVKKMEERYGTDTGSIVATIGPGICGECYEVDDPVVQDFSENLGLSLDQMAYFSPRPEKPGKYLLDIAQASTEQLRAAGVSKIEDLKLCTAQLGAPEGYTYEFYSYRRDGTPGEKSGRFMGCVTAPSKV